MKIPFTKAHGARNDFLLTWSEHLTSDFDPAAVAIAICNRHTGVGADGWLLVSPARPANIRNVRQRHAMRRRLPGRRGSAITEGIDSHRGWIKTAPPAGAQRPSVLFRDEHGRRERPGTARGHPRP